MEEMMPTENDVAIEAFKTITTTLYALPEKDRERVLRSAAILIGFEFLEEVEPRRRRT